MFLLAGILHPVDGQILKETLAISIIKEGVDHIYNCEFAEAAEVGDLLKKEWPGHPVVWLFAGMTDYWRYFPLSPGSTTTTGRLIPMPILFTSLLPFYFPGVTGKKGSQTWSLLQGTPSF